MRDCSVTHTLTVFYDGDCPLCRREIEIYRRRQGAERIEWRDLSTSPDREAAPGLSRHDALTRLYVMTADGRVVSGARAFATLWHALPATRRLGQIAGLPGIVHLGEAVYRIFLKARPLWRPHTCNDGVCEV